METRALVHVRLVLEKRECGVDTRERLEGLERRSREEREALAVELSIEEAFERGHEHRGRGLDHPEPESDQLGAMAAVDVEQAEASIAAHERRTQGRAKAHTH